MAENYLSLYEAIKIYKKQKTIQTVILIILFVFYLTYIWKFSSTSNHEATTDYISSNSGLPNPNKIPDNNSGTWVYIGMVIITWTFLAAGLLNVFAVVLLNYGNEKGNKDMLKAFMVFGCFAHNLFHICIEDFSLIIKRIEEIEQEDMTIKQIVSSADPESLEKG